MQRHIIRHCRMLMLGNDLLLLHLHLAVHLLQLGQGRALHHTGRLCPRHFLLMRKLVGGSGSHFGTAVVPTGDCACDGTNAATDKCADRAKHRAACYARLQKRHICCGKFNGFSKCRDGSLCDLCASKFLANGDCAINSRSKYSVTPAADSYSCSCIISPLRSTRCDRSYGRAL